MDQPFAVSDLLWIVGGLFAAFAAFVLLFIIGWLRMESRQDRRSDPPPPDDPADRDAPRRPDARDDEP